MNIVVCYVDDTNEILGYLFDTGLFKSAAQITEDDIRNVQNMYYKHSIKRFVRKPGIPQNAIKKVCVCLKMAQVDYALLPAEFIPYYKSLTQKYKVFNSEATIGAVVENFSISNTNGWDMLNICRKLRRAARENRVKVDVNAHKMNGGRNIQLFEFLSLCGCSVEQFIYQYLLDLQPFMLRPVKASLNCSNSDIIAIGDVFYKFEILLKYKVENNVGIYIISFHKSNKNGQMTRAGGIGGKIKSSTVTTRMSAKPYSAVLTDYNYSLETSNNYSMYRFSLTRGFMSLRLETNGKLVQPDLMVVDTVRLKKELDDSISSLLLNILKESGLDTEIIDAFYSSVSKNFTDYSITAFGGNLFNNLSFILEIVPQVKHNTNLYKALCELFMLLYTMYLPVNEWPKVLGVLQRRYFLNDSGNSTNTMLRALYDMGRYIQQGGDTDV